jgi:hypothetical protein
MHVHCASIPSSYLPSSLSQWRFNSNMQYFLFLSLFSLHQVGSLQPLREISVKIKQHNAAHSTDILFHSDGAQVRTADRGQRSLVKMPWGTDLFRGYALGLGALLSRLLSISLFHTELRSFLSRSISCQRVSLSRSVHQHLALYTALTPIELPPHILPPLYSNTLYYLISTAPIPDPIYPSSFSPLSAVIRKGLCRCADPRLGYAHYSR